MLNFWFVLLNIIFLGIDIGTMFVWFFFFLRNYFGTMLVH